MESIRVVVAENHHMFRDVIRHMVESFGKYEVVCEAKDGFEAIRCLRRNKADLLLLDLSMPRFNGISVIRNIRKIYPKLKILALTSYDLDEYVLETFEAGVNGYCLKTDSPAQLRLAMDSVMNDKVYVSPGISDPLLAGYLNTKVLMDS